MKKLSLTIVFALVCLISLHAQTRIIVISDPHTVSQENQARVTNQSGELDSYSYDIFSRAVENIITAKPDLVLVCGDMTYNGEVSSHQAAKGLLEKIRENGIPVKVIPGNHDVLDIYSGSLGEQNIDSATFASIYSDMGYEEGVARDAASLSWASSINEKLAVIGLDGNIYDGKSYYRDGCLRKSTLEWMKAQAADFQQEGKMVIAMVHQELLDRIMGFQATIAARTLLNTRYTHNPTVTSGEDLTDISLTDVQKAFADAGIHYVLTGHFHLHNVASATVKRTDGTSFKLTDISTGGLSTYPSCMHTLLVDEATGTVSTTTSLVEKVLNEKGEDIQDLTEAEISKLDDEYPTIKMMGLSFANIFGAQLQNEPLEIYAGTEVTHDGAFPSVIYTTFVNNTSWNVLQLPFASLASDWSGSFDVAMPGKSSDAPTLLAANDTIPENMLTYIRLKSSLPTGRYSITSSVKDANKQTAVTPPASSVTALEDVNRDNIIDIEDIKAIIDVICGGSLPIDEGLRGFNADVNRDGAVNVLDVNAVINLVCLGR